MWMNKNIHLCLQCMYIHTKKVICICVCNENTKKIIQIQKNFYTRVCNVNVINKYTLVFLISKKIKILNTKYKK